MAGRFTSAGVRKKHALQLFKTDMCKFYLRGRCENGENCSYAHNPDEVRLKPDLTRTSICRTFLQTGMCEDETCRFAHTDDQLRATRGFFKMKMCAFAQSGRCKNRDNCRFAHTKEELRPAKPDAVPIEMQLHGSQQPNSSSAHPDSFATEGTCAAQLPSNGVEKMPSFGSEKRDHDADGLYIFGVGGPELQQEEAPPPPPELQAVGMEPSTGRRGAGSRCIGQSPSQELNYPHAERASGTQDRKDRSTQPSRIGGNGAATIVANESDSVEGSSWSGNSGVTEVPRSEHTAMGCSPTTSECSSGAGSNKLHAAGSTSGTAGAPAAQQRRRDKEKQKKRASENGTNGAPKVTTLLIMNVPTYLTQGALLSMLEDFTPTMRGHFDFFYCPWEEKVSHSLGYALVNFVDAQQALAFKQQWSNRELCRGGRGGGLRVMKAAVQGYEANLKYFSTVEITQCSDLRFRPLYRDAEGMLQPLQFEASECSGQSQPMMQPSQVLLPGQRHGQTPHEREQPVQHMMLQMQHATGDFGATSSHQVAILPDQAWPSHGDSRSQQGMCWPVMMVPVHVCQMNGDLRDCSGYQVMESPMVQHSNGVPPVPMAGAWPDSDQVYTD